VKIIAANWKMDGSKELIDNLAISLSDLKLVFNFIFCPPFTLIDYSIQKFASFAKIGAQDCSVFENGPHTGDISCSRLADIGCSFVIIGHSERRKSGDYDSAIKTKIENAQKAGINQIVCVGEDLNTYESGKTLDFLSQQIKVLKSVLNNNTVIAYEPIWAIGTGKIPILKEIEKIHNFIEKETGLTVIYGGSVTLNNYIDILSIKSVGGVLVGGESLKIERFSKMLYTW
jgi:triosephosphate isomerase